ncbi:hypothetical protein niasHT_007237 [Heterodera trifolii]|uniref:Uncharacterized protein n=1 Tax=Heterodera trifolii TaxID=157864 RepID=A0ABD2LL17_9BILA
MMRRIEKAMAEEKMPPFDAKVPKIKMAPAETQSDNKTIKKTSSIEVIKKLWLDSIGQFLTIVWTTGCVLIIANFLLCVEQDLNIVENDWRLHLPSGGTSPVIGDGRRGNVGLKNEMKTYGFWKREKTEEKRCADYKRMTAQLFVILYMLLLQSYSGSLLVQLAYWLLENHLLEQFDQLMDSIGGGTPHSHSHRPMSAAQRQMQRRRMFGEGP